MDDIRKKRLSAFRFGSYWFIVQGLSILVLVSLMFSCGAQKNACQHTAIPVSSLLDTFKGEQGDVLRRYGLPDGAYQEPLGLTRWIYCDALGDPLLIEFSSDGSVISMQLIWKNGQGRKKDLVEARMYYEIACVKGEFIRASSREGCGEKEKADR